MNKIFLFSFMVVLAGCFDSASNSFDKKYYEETTKIKFPNDYEIVTTADNGEFMTISIIDLGKSDCKNFVRHNKFERLDKDEYSIFSKFKPFLTGTVLLDSAYRKLPDKNLLVKQKSYENGTEWIYFIDTITCRLYCQINYPDKEGN